MQPKFKRTRALVAALAGIAAILAGCSVTFPLVGRYEDGETFRGSIDSDLAGSAHIAATSSSGTRCSGQSRITYKPPYALIVPCVGQRGIAVMQCDDGRRVRGEWVATGCTSGYGEGFDQDGRRLFFAMGMSLEEAAAKRGEPAATAAPAPRGATPHAAPARTGRRVTGNGTGFFVTSDGYIVTNAHVISKDRNYFAMLRGQEMALHLIDSDAAHDLALVKVEAQGVPIPIAPGVPAKGEDVTALGFPVVERLGSELKATFGKINSLSGLEGDVRLMQIDTPVQPGNSGGPLLNMRGEVVGVVAATFSTAANVRRTGGALPQNVNYAVKAEYLIPLLEKNIPGKWRRGGGARFANTADLVRQREASVVLIVVR